MAAVYKFRNLVSGVPHLILPGVHLAGRSEEADIQLAHDSISRRHARIHNTDSGVWVEDLNSSNGTYVQGRRIEGSVPVGLGEEIRLGAITFRLDPEVGQAGGQGERLASDAPPPVEAFQRRTNRITADELDAAKRVEKRPVPLPQKPQPSPVGSTARFPGSSLLKTAEPAASAPTGAAPSSAATAATVERPVWSYFFAGVIIGAVLGAGLTLLIIYL